LIWLELAGYGCRPPPWRHTPSGWRASPSLGPPTQPAGISQPAPGIGGTAQVPNHEKRLNRRRSGPVSASGGESWTLKRVKKKSQPVSGIRSRSSSRPRLHSPERGR
jgi:hypothetical protein